MAPDQHRPDQHGPDQADQPDQPDQANLSPAAQREPAPGPHHAQAESAASSEQDRLFSRGSFLESSRIAGVLRA